LSLRPRNESFHRPHSSHHILHRIRRQDFEHHLRAEDKALYEEVMVVFDREIDFGLRSGIKQSFLLRGQGFDQFLLTLCYLFAIMSSDEFAN